VYVFGTTVYETSWSSVSPWKDLLS